MTDNVSKEMEQVASEVTARIASLNALSEQDLTNEMAELKRTLVANPAASLLLKDEDIGILVTNLRRILGVAVASAASAKTSKPKKQATVRLTPEELKAALDEM